MYAKSYYEFPCRHAPVPGVTEINFQKQTTADASVSAHSLLFLFKVFLCTEKSSEIGSVTLLIIQNTKASIAGLEMHSFWKRNITLISRDQPQWRVPFHAPQAFDLYFVVKEYL